MHMLISPMLLESQDNPFSDPAFIFEPKMDGHRLILIKKGDETRLFTREQTECTRQYPELHDVPVKVTLFLTARSAVLIRIRELRISSLSWNVCS